MAQGERNGAFVDTSDSPAGPFEAISRRKTSTAQDSRNLFSELIIQSTTNKMLQNLTTIVYT